MDWLTRLKVGDTVTLPYDGKMYTWTVTKENKKTFGVNYYQEKPLHIMNLYLDKQTGNIKK